MNNEEMLKALIKNELLFLIDNPDALGEIVDFFAKGGFSTWPAETIQREYNNFMA
jgi:hypothetical protein